MKTVRNFSCYANIKETVKNFIPKINVGDEVPFEFLDEGTQGAIVETIKGFTKMTDKESIEIARSIVYKALMTDVPEFEMEVEYSFSWDETSKIFLIPIEKREVVEEHGATIDAMDFIISEVAKHNKKLEMLLRATAKDGVESWVNLNDIVIEEALKIYNNASINLRTKEIVSL